MDEPFVKLSEDWIKYEGKSCQVKPETQVIVKFTNGEISKIQRDPDWWHWGCDKTEDFSIVAYKISKQEEKEIDNEDNFMYNLDKLMQDFVNARDFFYKLELRAANAKAEMDFAFEKLKDEVEKAGLNLSIPDDEDLCR